MIEQQWSDLNELAYSSKWAECVLGNFKPISLITESVLEAAPAAKSRQSLPEPTGGISMWKLSKKPGSLIVGSWLPLGPELPLSLFTGVL